MLRFAILSAACLALCLAGCRRTPPDDDPKPPTGLLLAPDDNALTVLAKAVLVHGDRKSFTVWRCGHLEYRMKGVAAEEVVIEDTFQLPGRFKRVTRLKVGEREVPIVLVLVDGKGWSKKGDAPAEPTTNDLTDNAEHLFAGYCNLGPLTKDSVQLARLADARVDGKEAAVLRARSEKLGEADYYFSARSGLLMKSRKLVPVLTECHLDDYRSFQGIRVPMRITVAQDGKTTLDVTLLRVRFYERHDEGTFAKP